MFRKNTVFSNVYYLKHQKRFLRKIPCSNKFYSDGIILIPLSDAKTFPSVPQNSAEIDR